MNGITNVFWQEVGDAWSITVWEGDSSKSFAISLLADNKLALYRNGTKTREI